MIGPRIAWHVPAGIDLFAWFCQHCPTAGRPLREPTGLALFTALDEGAAVNEEGR
jgi:hypothetical protein